MGSPDLELPDTTSVLTVFFRNFQADILGINIMEINQTPAGWYFGLTGIYNGRRSRFFGLTG